MTIWTKSFIALFITNMFFNMGMLMSGALLAVYADSIGASPSAIGMLVGGYAVSSILLRPVAAPIIDSYNRKRLVILSCLVLAASFLGFGASGSIRALLFFRLLQGCGLVFGNACCLVIVSDMLPREKYSSGIGSFSLAQATSQAVGPYVGLWLLDMSGYKMTFVISAVIMLLAALLASRVSVGAVEARKFRLAASNVISKEALLPASMVMIMNVGASATQFLVVFASGYGLRSRIGLYFLISAGVMFATRPLIGRLTDRFGAVYVCVPAFIVSVVSYYIISVSVTMTGFVIAAVIAAFGQGACLPAMQALSMKAVPRERRGVASSTNYIGFDLGYLIGPTLAGYAAQSYGYVTMWHVMGAPFLIGVFMLVCFRKRIGAIERTFAAG